MKKHYENPQVYIEEFVANEYVAACNTYTAWLTCALPGTSTSTVDDYDGTSSQWYYEKGKSLPHGLCGYPGKVDITSGGTGYEYVDGKADTSRKISNVVIGAKVATGTTTGYTSSPGSHTGDLEDGATYRATWQSTDGSATYTHCGRAVVEGTPMSRPNHS